MCCAVIAAAFSGLGPRAAAQTTDDLLFIHHSSGRNWLNHSLHEALLAKDYIDERNEMYYWFDIDPDVGRPDSLGPLPGDNTNMNHWLYWFNDYLDNLKTYSSADGVNRIVMFKSCFTPSDEIGPDGPSPADPFAELGTLANYKAVFQHPDGGGNSYTNGGYQYFALEDVFAANPDTLFIPVTFPPRHYAPYDQVTDDEAQRARDFSDWLTGSWQDQYDAAHPGANNVAVFNWFDILANPADDPDHPNRLRAEYGGESGDSHPNATANADSTYLFATAADNFIDAAWAAFIAPDFVPGDFNLDGKANLLDINDFVLAMTDWSAYVLAYPEADITLIDPSQGANPADPVINLLDISYFVDIMTSSAAGHAVPEPATGAWLAVAAIAATTRRRRPRHAS